MTGVLLDTHVWVWMVEGLDRLPTGLRREVERRAGTVWLSPVSVWEVGLLARRGRLELGLPLRAWVDRARASLATNEARLTSEVALAADEIEQAVKDPADRFIAATAQVYDLTLLTVDEGLRGLRGVHTRSR